MSSANQESKACAAWKLCEESEEDEEGEEGEGGTSAPTQSHVLEARVLGGEFRCWD